MDITTMSPGTLYIGLPGDDKLTPLSEVAEADLVNAVEEKDDIAVKKIIDINTQEATFMLTLTQEQVDSFFDTLYHIRDNVLKIIRNDGHTRVCHLAKHAKKWRTRKKNIHRAYRLLEKEG